MATNPDYKAEKGTRRAARLHVRPTRRRTHQISLTRTPLFLPARLSRIPQPRAPAHLAEKCAAFLRSFQSPAGDGFKYLNMLQEIADRQRETLDIDLSDLEEQHLIAALSEDLQFIATFLLHTGLRSRELCALRWDWLVKRDAITCFELHGEHTKNSQDKLIVCNREALKVLARQAGRHETRTAMLAQANASSELAFSLIQQAETALAL